MLYLHYSNQLEALLEPLARRLDRSDPFVEHVIAVPNRNLQAWLNFQLSEPERLGIAINLRFSFLDPLLLQLTGEQPTELLDEHVLHMMIVRLLREYVDGDEPELASLRRYLASESVVDHELRIFELAKRMTAVFREYAFSRGEMIAAWEVDQRIFESSSVEVWQQRLWRDCFGPKGVIARRNAVQGSGGGRLLTPLHQLDLAKAEMKRPLHVFGISYVSRFHQQMLRRLGEVGDVFIYVLNPCRMFWEDVASWRELKQVSIRLEDEAQGELSLPDDNPLLQAWGRPGREYMRLLNDAARWDYGDHFVVAEPRTLLARLQRDVLDRRPPPEKAVFDKDDASLQVLGCPGPRREAEVVASQIWDLVLARKDLQFQDMAVIVTDMAAYQSDLEAAFQEIGEIPYNLIDGRFGPASRLVEAVKLLLALPETRFDRESLFRLYRHPNFGARFPEADPDQWLQLADSLAIFHGRNRQAHQGYLDKDLYNWDQGFKRLLLGAYVHGDEGEDDAPVFAAGQDAYLVHPLQGSEIADAQLFYTVTQSLLQDTGDLANLTLSAPDWADYFRGLLDAYLAPASGEEAEFERLRRAASTVEDLSEALANPLEPLSFTFAKSFFVQALDQIKPPRGQYLADGVTVSSLMPMRPIPFKVVFVMGLDERRFPRPVSRDPLDLRWARERTTAGVRERRIGDVDDRERDRYMFLETMISAREQLILSFVNRDETTGDLVNPSPVLSELIHWASVYQPDFGVTDHPLKAYSAEYGFGPGPGLVHYDVKAARLAGIREARQDLLSQGRDPKGALDEAATVLLGAAAPVFADAAPVERIQISLSQLRAFLECPLQATAKRVLRLREEEDDLAGKRDEPFALEVLGRWRVLNGAMEALLTEHLGGFAEPRGLAALLDDHAERAEAEGVMPAGFFYPIFRERLLGILRDWCAALNELGLRDRAARYRFEHGGDAPERFRPPAMQFELEINGHPLVVDVTGRTQFVFGAGGDEPMLVHFYAKEVKTGAKRWTRHHLRGYVDGLALASSGLGERMQSVIVGAKATVDPPLMYAWGQDEAKTQLKGLLGDLLSGAHDYLLPIDLVYKLRDHRNSADVQTHYQSEWDKLHHNERQTCASSYGPLHDWRTYPPATDVATLLRRRFDRFLDAVEGSS